MQKDGDKNRRCLFWADKNALHVKMADEAYCIGPAGPTSLISMFKTFCQLQRLPEQAIHRDTGFVENPAFADVVEKCGLSLSDLIQKQ